MLVLQTYRATVKPELLIAMSEHQYFYVHSNMYPGFRATDVEPKKSMSPSVRFF